MLDVVHGLRGVRAASAVLAQSLPEGPRASVHLVVVDPGVGGDRRAVVITCGDDSMLVGPDNGIFFPVADRLGGAVAVHELVEPWFMRPQTSRTFHGRDIFAPAAAHLALGVAPGEFGPGVDPSDLVRLEMPFVDAAPGRLEAETLRTDWYGNIQTAATGADLAASGLEGRVRVNGVAATIGEKFADVEPGALLVYVNSAGHVALACNRASAVDLLAPDGRVTIERT